MNHMCVLPFMPGIGLHTAQGEARFSGAINCLQLLMQYTSTEFF